MKLSKSVTAILPVLVSAHGDSYLRARHGHIRARQVGASDAAVGVSSLPVETFASSAIISSSVSSAVSISSESGSSSGPPITTTPLISTPVATFHLQSTNPTAVPLSGINSLQSSSVTKSLDSTAVAGTLPTFLPGAPALPDAALLKPADYPALDKIPPLDSPEVQRWIQDVKDTGVTIPGFSPTNLGGCTNNTAALTDPPRCWWTCGGCTRSTDISDCPTTMDWGLTYDDGPSFYTSNLLSYLDQEKLKSTFFVVGSRVISFPAILQTEYLGQHQIAVHTWSHASLTTLTNEQIIAELGWSKKVIKDVLGVTPNMMRPPFGDIDDRVRAISLAMGLTPVMWTRISPLATFDTDDFNIQTGATSVEQVLQNWGHILSNVTTRSSGFIVLEHDLFEQTVEVATGYILPDALAHKPHFAIQPVISCLKKKMTDAYIETNDNTTNPPALSAAINAGLVKATGTPSASASASANKSAAGSVYFDSINVLSVAIAVLGLTFGGLSSVYF